MTRIQLDGKKLDEFLGKIVPEPNSGCWLWDGVCSTDGYARFSIVGYGNNQKNAHRVAYEHFVAEIPKGMEIDHKCYVRCCVNPNHLRVVSPLENRRGQAGAIKTNCLHGHELSGRNLIIRSDGRQRDCRECQNKRAREYRKRNSGKRMAT